MQHPNKIAWIHCDYASYYDLNNRKDESAVYNNFRSVVCVSKFTSMSFNNIYPKYQDKVKAINNIRVM